MSLTLDPDGGGDYTLDPKACTCWITVGEISVHIMRGDKGMQIALYPLGDEMSDPIDTAEALFKQEAA